MERLSLDAISENVFVYLLGKFPCGRRDGLLGWMMMLMKLMLMKLMLMMRLGGELARGVVPTFDERDVGRWCDLLLREGFGGV